jgi:hypothetical protein
VKQTRKNIIERECAIKKVNITWYCTGAFSSFIRLYSFSVFVGVYNCFGMRVAFIKWVMVYLIKKVHWLVLALSLLINLNWSIDKISLYISLRPSMSLMLRVIQLFLTFMWPCTVTNFCVIKPTRCINFTNLFCHETLHISDICSVHH